MTDLLDLALHVVERARSGEQVEAYVVHGRETEVRAYGGEVESLSSAESHGIGVRVVADGRQGVAYAGTLDETAIDETLAEARDNAAFATPDEFNGLAEPDAVAPADLDLYRPELAEFPADEKVALALALEKAVRAADQRVTGVESAEYGDAMSETAVATSTGLAVAGRETGCWLATYPLASDGEETQTGFGFSVGRSPADLDLERTATEAATRATRLLGATKPPSERLTVVLDPWVTAQLVGIVAHTLTGDAVLKGRSPFGDRLGDAVAAPLVTLVDDPTDPDAFGATSTDDEGLSTRRNALFDGGTLRGFVHSAYTGRRSGATSTGNGVRGGFKDTPSSGCMAVRIEPGVQSPEALVAEVGDGLLVQEVSGLHSGVNPVSGDFSTGASGLRIRGGEIAEPVREFTIASTLQRMLQDVVAVGNDLEWLPMTAAGVTLVVGDVTVSGA